MNKIIGNYLVFYHVMSIHLKNFEVYLLHDLIDS